MIENLRGRSTETKYGRIPLWLYETGIGLQAIATYGWLHGRYGHYERVMPSYATLAKELGVSRGSVIAYVKALVSVGAVRIETSGAAGRQTNLYAIAFNEPFAVAGQQTDGGGQNTDRVVSGLYSTGQNADRGGQPVVQEEDVSTKTEDGLSLPSAPERTAAPAAASGERETMAAPSDKTTTFTTAAAVKVPALRGEERQQQGQGGAQAPSEAPVAPTGAPEKSAQRVVDAYVAALGRPVLARTRTALHGQVAELLAVGYPEAWLTDRARELADHGWTDLAKHAEKSTVPLPDAKPSTAAPVRPELPTWCGDLDCSEIGRMRDVEDAAGHRMVMRCPKCHPHASQAA